MEFCEDYPQCENLEGQLFITRTLDGPPLAVHDDLNLGIYSVPRAVIRPFVKLSFQQKWIPKEMCYGPVNRVMGLAPCESITTDIRTVQHQEYTQLVQRAMESSEVTTNTRSEGRELIDNNWNGNTVDLSKITVGEWGSFWEVAGAVVGAIVGGPIGAGVGAWVGGAIDDATSGGGGGGGATATGKMLSVISETLETVQKSQSQSLVTETTTSASTTREQSISRTFRNPYKNRTLELRFMPTYRHYEVVTYLYRFVYGIALDVGNVAFPRSGLGITSGDFLQARLRDQRIMSVANAELGLNDEISAAIRKTPISDHLNANPEIYTKELLRHLHQRRDEGTLQQPMVSALTKAVKDDAEANDLIKSLAWSSAYAQDKSIYFPLTDPDLAIPKLNMSKKNEQIFRGKIDHLKPEILQKVTITRDLHVFTGTHVEVAPGQCILPDLADDCECANCQQHEDNGQDH